MWEKTEIETKRLSDLLKALSLDALLLELEGEDIHLEGAKLIDK